MRPRHSTTALVLSLVAATAFVVYACAARPSWIYQQSAIGFLFAALAVATGVFLYGVVLDLRRPKHHFHTIAEITSADLQEGEADGSHEHSSHG